MYLYTSLIYDFGFDLNIRDTKKPNINAELIPAADAVNPPVITPKKPLSSTAFLTPSIRTEPNPVNGTLAPAPAKSIIGLYKSNNCKTVPVHTNATSIVAGVNFVLSNKTCPNAHIIPPTINALT